MKYLALVLLFFGEATVIYAEELGARLYRTAPVFSSAFFPTLVPLLIGSCALVVAYIFGLKYFQNIWVVTAVSFASILIVEPLFDFFYIGNMPTLGESIGFILAVLGIGATLFIP